MSRRSLFLAAYHCSPHCFITLWALAMLDPERAITSAIAGVSPPNEPRIDRSRKPPSGCLAFLLPPCSAALLPSFSSATARRLVESTKDSGVPEIPRKPGKRKVKAAVRIQYGVLPYRFTTDASLEVLLVTTRRTRRAMGRRWLSGKVEGIEAIAAREGFSERSTRMGLSLAFLAPDIVQAAVEGTLPRGLGVSRLNESPSSRSSATARRRRSRQRSAL